MNLNTGSREDHVVDGRKPGVTRVMIVEDEPLFRELLTSTLSAYDTIQVVAAVDNGKDAITLAEEVLPDVVLMDIELGAEPDGIKAAHQIKAADPTVGIVILSMHRDKQYLASLPEKRAAGWSYMLKQNIRDKNSLIRAIEGSAWGLVSMDPAITEDLRPRKRSVLERLTQQQMVALEKLASGYTDEVIAAKLGIDVSALGDLVEKTYADLGIEVEGGVDPRVRAVLLYLQETSSQR